MSTQHNSLVCVQVAQAVLLHLELRHLAERILKFGPFLIVKKTIIQNLDISVLLETCG